MPRVLLVLAVLSASIFCIIECIQTDEQEVRNLPKLVWVLLILLAPILGPLAWFVAGRPRRNRPGARPSPTGGPPRPASPDDDPTFLAGLDRTNDERRRLEAVWERELAERDRDAPSTPDERGTSSAPEERDGSTALEERGSAFDASEPDGPDGPGDETASRS